MRISKERLAFIACQGVIIEAKAACERAETYLEREGRREAARITYDARLRLSEALTALGPSPAPKEGK